MLVVNQGSALQLQKSDLAFLILKASYNDVAKISRFPAVE